MIYFTSDHHFGHKNIISYCDRPFKDVEEMNVHLIQKWNETVGVDDHVWYLGDFAFSRRNRIEEILIQLNGHKHLIKGNHDNHKDHKTIEFWESYEKLKELRSEYGLVTLCHYPLEDWRDMNYGTYHLHGHCHGARGPYGRRLDIGIDSAVEYLGEYRPFSFEEVDEILSKRTPAKHYAGKN